MRLDEVPLPDTSAARLAAEVAAEYHSPALLNHVHRSYLWAASLGTQEGLTFDAELLYVAAMLHDIGLVEPFDSHTVAFEHAGGHVARVFAAGAGWPPARRRRHPRRAPAALAGGAGGGGARRVPAPRPRRRVRALRRGPGGAQARHRR